MKTDFIKMQIASHNWAITPASLSAIHDFVDSGADLDPALFHREIEKPTAQFGSQVPGSLYSYKSGTVGAILIDGPIIPRATMFSDVSGIVSIDRLTAEFKAMADDPNITEIVLLMDTPGGEVTGVSDFAALVKATEKKTSAFTWMAASAGYWIASAVDEIAAPLSGLVGSIGVVVGYYDTTEAEAKKGFKYLEMVSSQSPNKRADLGTDTGRAVVQQMLDDLADGFISTVADNRGTDADTVINSFGGGAVFAAPRALSAGMIDRVVDFDAYMKTKQDAGPEKTFFGFARKGNAAMDEHESTVETVDVEKALSAERDRIKGIEALITKVEGHHPAVVKAAKDEIDRIKYDPAYTAANAAVNVLEAVSKAQKNLVTTLAQDKKEVTEAAQAAAQAGEADTAEELAAKESENRIAALKAAREKV